MANKSTDVKLTPRDQQLLVAAFLSVKDGFEGIKLDYDKFASIARLKNANTANTIWYGVRKKILAGATPENKDSLGGKALSRSTASTNDSSAVSSDLPADEGESSTPQSDKKKRTKKPKTSGDGEKAPAPKRIKKSAAEVKPEPISSPVADATAFANGHSFTAINPDGVTIPSGAPLTLQEGETLGDDLTNELPGEGS